MLYFLFLKGHNTQNANDMSLMKSIAAGEQKEGFSSVQYSMCKVIVAAVLLLLVTLLLKFNVIRVARLAVNGLRPRHASEMRLIIWSNPGKGRAGEK